MDNSGNFHAERAPTGGLTQLRAFFRQSGPGWLQSAITLGGGSLAGALYLGAIGGAQMLWVQLFAMLFGAIMLAAISYVTLSIDTTPFEGIRTKINPVLAWGWLAATLLANAIWIMPQFALAYASLTENLLPNLFSNPDSPFLKYGVSIVIFVLVAWITWKQDQAGPGIRWYVNILKVLVGLVVLSFMLVIVLIAGQLNWLEVLAGFLPNVMLIFEPATAYESVLAQIADGSARAYWTDLLLGIQRDRMVAAAASAVGINMTFLMPYALISRGWNKKHRNLAVWDLAMGMVLPFILATGCIVLAAGVSFQAVPYEGLVDTASGQVQVNAESPKHEEFQRLIAGRNQAVVGADVSDPERLLAAMLIPRSNRELASSLSRLTGSTTATQWLFGAGVLAMTLSTIAILILISVYVFKEIAATRGSPPGATWPVKAAILIGSLGLLWPALWEGTARAYLAVPASVAGYTLLPIAFIAFFWMMNSRRLLGPERPAGGKRILWNVLMLSAIGTSGLAAVVTGWNTSFNGIPVGAILLITFVVLLGLGQWKIKKDVR